VPDLEAVRRRRDHARGHPRLTSTGRTLRGSTSTGSALRRSTIGRGARIALVAAVLAGCATPEAEQPGVAVSVDVDRETRIAEVARARAAVGAPVGALVAAARAVVADLRSARLDPALDGPGRAAAVGALPDRGLVTARDELAALELEGDGPDVAAARAAVADLVAAGEDVVRAVAAEVAEVPALVEHDAALAEVVTVWDEPGSRAARVTDLGAAAASAEALRATAATATPTVPCLGVWERRVTAAMTVRDRSQELAGLVGGSTGVAYDEARDAWRDDPTGLGGPADALDVAAGSCWDEGSLAALSAAALDGLLAALEATLDPDDLVR
jgi:hypothetical protein